MTPARILVVRLGAMGDIVHTLPAVASLKHSYPGSRLTWAVESQWMPLLEGNPYIDRVVAVRRGSAGEILATCKELRAETYDFAVDFQGLLKSAVTASLARPDRIFGFHASLLRERAAGAFYSQAAASSAAHMVDRNLDLAAAAGAASILRTFPLPPGRPEGELPQGPFVLACPLAGWKAKQWPLEYYAVIAARLRRDLGIALVLNGAPSAMPVLAAVPDTVPHVSGLPGLIDATRRSVAVLGIDSGPLHVAAALGRPGVAIFGPTDPARNGPYGEGFLTLRSPRAVTSYKRRPLIDESMRDISPEQVFDALKAQLVARPHSAGCMA